MLALLDYPDRRWDDIVRVEYDGKSTAYGNVLDPSGALQWRALDDQVAEHMTRKAWIAAMLNDRERCSAYERAINAAIESIDKSDVVVLDVGAGTGLLSAMAARHSAVSRVIAIEMEDAMVQVARQQLDHVAKVKVIAGHSTTIDCTEKASLVVCELLDHFLLGEGWLPSTRDAAERLAEPDAVFIPSAATIYCAIVAGPLRQVDQCRSARSTRSAVRLEASDLELLTEAVVARRFTIPVASKDFEASTCSLIATRSGFATSVVYWWAVDLWEGIEQLSTAPPTRQDHWAQAIQPIGPFELKCAGDEVMLHVQPRDDGIWFALQHDSEDYGCDCGWHTWSSAFRREILTVALESPLVDTILDVSDSGLRGLRVVQARSTATCVCVCTDARDACRTSQRHPRLVVARRPPSSSTDLAELQLNFEYFDAVCAEPYYADLQGNPLMMLLRTWQRYDTSRPLHSAGCRYAPRFAHLRCRALRSDRIRAAYAPLPLRIGPCPNHAARHAWNCVRTSKLVSLDLGQYRDDLVLLGEDALLTTFDLKLPTPRQKQLDLKGTLRLPTHEPVPDLIALYVDYQDELANVESPGNQQPVRFALVRFCEPADFESVDTSKRNTVHLRVVLHLDGTCEMFFSTAARELPARYSDAVSQVKRPRKDVDHI